MPLQATFRSADGRVSLTCSVDTQRAMVRAYASFEELFGVEVCGRCGSTDSQWQVRTPQEYVFFERVCQNPECGAQLSYGQTKEGGRLFPKRRDRDGNWLPDRGWTVHSSGAGGAGGGAGDGGSTQTAPAREPISEDDIPF